MNPNDLNLRSIEDVGAPTVDQMLNAAYKLGDWLNFDWNFYIVFVSAVLGWVFIGKSSWDIWQQIVVTTFFGGFAVMSFITLARTYLALHATSLLIADHWPAQKFQQAVLLKLAQPRWQLEMGMHACADVAVISCIWAFA